MQANIQLYQRLLFALIMSILTSGIVSAVLTWINIQNSALFLHKWSYAFLLAWPLVFISILVIAPMVNRLVSYLMKH
jgi:hypothetical protein